MTKNAKLLIAAAAVLVILGGTAAALLLTAPNDADSSSVSAQEFTSKLFYDLNPEDITEVTAVNSRGGYSLKRDASGKFSEKGVDDDLLNATMAANLTSAASTLSAADTVEEDAEDLSKYGLDGSTSVKVVFGGSKPQTYDMVIGSVSPTSGNYYFCMKGEKTVYLVEKTALSYATIASDDFIIRQLTPTSDSNDTLPTVNKLTVQRNDLDYIIELSLDNTRVAKKSDYTYDTEHIMTAPVNVLLTPENATPVIRGMLGLTAGGMLVVHPSEEELEYAGINAPFMTVTATIDSEDYVLHIGNQADFGTGEAVYFGYLDGVDVLYYFTAESLPWLTMDIDTVASTMVVDYSIFKLGTLEVNGEKFNVTGDSSTEIKVTRNGKEMDAEIFKQLYRYILGLTQEKIILHMAEVNQEECVSTVILTLRDGTTKKLEFYTTAEGDKLAIAVDGAFTYYCAKDYADELKKCIVALDSGEEINVE